MAETAVAAVQPTVVDEGGASDCLLVDGYRSAVSRCAPLLPYWVQSLQRVLVPLAPRESRSLLSMR
eukprot:5585919-Alexandrium_andersonii.AAC.1